MTPIPKGRPGFTLIEIIITISVLALLLTVTVIAIDPARRFAEANNSRRQTDLYALLAAVVRYQAFNRGNLPAGLDSIASQAQVIGANAAGCSAGCSATSTVSACLNLGSSLVETYLAEIPVDPASGTPGNSDYYINRGADGKIIVGACDPELLATISVNR